MISVGGFSRPLTTTAAAVAGTRQSMPTADSPATEARPTTSIRTRRAVRPSPRRRLLLQLDLRPMPGQARVPSKRHHTRAAHPRLRRSPGSGPLWQPPRPGRCPPCSGHSRDSTAYFHHGRASSHPRRQAEGRPPARRPNPSPSIKRCCTSNAGRAPNRPRPAPQRTGKRPSSLDEGRPGRVQQRIVRIEDRHCGQRPEGLPGPIWNAIKMAIVRCQALLMEFAGGSTDGGSRQFSRDPRS
jgi:hypothetical protein